MASRILLRGGAAFLAAFSILSVIAELRGRTPDASLWLVDLRDVASTGRIGLLAATGILLAAWALRRSPGRSLARLAAAVCAVLAVVALRDAVGFFGLASSKVIQPGVPVPLSALLAIGLAVMSLGILRAGPPEIQRRPLAWAGIVAAAGAWAAAFALAQMLFFGTTDYRRPADVAVVLGARVYASGLPSPLLADRIRTAVGLYEDGLVPTLLMSGGDGADGYNEAEVMRDVAVSAGVEAADIIVDRDGASTEATVTDVELLLREGAWSGLQSRVIVVTQAWHLPRVQLAFAVAGLDVLTVPASEREPIRDTPLLVLREVPAFWAYYLQVCLG